jgi:hypothetical protein
MPSAAFHGFARVAGEIGLSLVDVAVGTRDAHCGIPLGSVPDWEERKRRLVTACRDASFEGDCAIVSLVGRDLTLGAGALTEVLDVLQGAGVEAKTLHAGALRVAATIPAARLADAQRALHGRFVDVPGCAKPS